MDELSKNPCYTFMMPHPDPMMIEAGGHAFGDGSHPSTRGVLEALARIDPAAFTPRHACDIGAGSGIISFAIAQKFGCPVLATDIAKSAVETLKDNIVRNSRLNRPLPPRGRDGEGPQVANSAASDGPHLTSPLLGEEYAVRGDGRGQMQAAVTPLYADGFTHPEIAARAPFDLIVMNILPEPLLKLAGAANAHLAEGGALILSGILLSKEPIIIQSYQALELELTTRIVIGDWVTLLWQKE